ncbi:MAG: ABC transporter ATP-binding protein [Gammaproteobacteria bacterium]|nr:ABC transporter ATP-binding protein [Gammaproteobacteria bacterium]
MTDFDIIIRQLSLSYHTKPLFVDLNLSLAAGQWIALLGTSGVGKSTLLRYIANLPSDCQVNSQATITTSDQQSLCHRVAYLSQHDSLLPWLSIMDNLLLPCRLGKKSLTAMLKQQALTLLHQVGLAEETHTLMPHQLSGGMRQRVMLARALLDKKAAILMDEPFSAVDAVTRLKLQKLAARLLRGHTVLMVTHDPAEALTLADVVYVMRGRPAQLISTAITPRGNSPRDPSDSQLLQQQSQLLNLLATEESDESY